jgi:gamma-glutamyltranspeptidase/glutathione hydrolase
MRAICGSKWIAAVFLCTTPARAEEPTRPAVAANGMVVCVSPPGADVGVAVLQKGGNAVDAAVAVAFAMAVTYPQAGNIGGGGFMLIHPPAGRGAPTVIEYRETAPAAATVNLFVNGRDSYSHHAVGVPGTVRGLELAYTKYGSKAVSWAELVAPAIRLADAGFPLEAYSARSLNRILQNSPKHAELHRVFGKPGGVGWVAGDVLTQPDLARTLRRVAENGSDGFYTGPVAALVAEEMRRGNGLITAADLAGYRARERAPVHGTYRGLDVWSASPPSGGGTTLVQMLNMLETFDLKAMGPGSAARWHTTAEVMRRAFADRARYLGDPDFAAIPPHLLAKDHARRLAAGIDPARATRSDTLTPDVPLPGEADHTTHFGVVDASGLAVANTYTLEDSYGSRIVVPGAGFILNNEMNDFNPVPGVTTRRGQVGTPANLVAPGKRMLSSQTPTILAKDGHVVLVTGSPGGRTIPNTVLCVVTNFVDFGMDVQAAVDFPRLHQQWMPDEIRLERFKTRSALVGELQWRGHLVTTHTPDRFQGDAHSIAVDPAGGKRTGAADRRIMGKAAGY